jgi:hypothetical protein
MRNDKTAAPQMLVQAFDHLRSAIDLLDEAGAPAHIAATLDLARNRLLNELPALEQASFKIDETWETAQPS